MPLAALGLAGRFFGPFQIGCNRCRDYAAGKGEGKERIPWVRLGARCSPPEYRLGCKHAVDQDDNGQTSHQYNYFRIKLLTEEGRKHADIEIPFFKDQGTSSTSRPHWILSDESFTKQAKFSLKPFS